MRRAGRLVASVLTAVALAAPLAAQNTYSPAHVPYGHWSVDAVRTLAALGLIPAGRDASQRVPSQIDIARSLEAAAAADTSGESLADEWLERYRNEFALDPDDANLAGRHLAGTSASLGYVQQKGRIATGTGYGFFYPGADWNQPEPLEDLSEAAGVASLQVTLWKLAARVTAAQPPHAEALREAYVAARFGVVGAWVGRRQFAWGPGVGPGIVMNGGRYDSFGLETSPFRLPGALRRAGPVSFELALGQEDFETSYDDVAFLATRGSITPHERLGLGVSRAAFFGGEGNSEVDLFAIFSVLIGKHAGDISELDNQLVAVDASYRLPTERWIPLRGWIEWGFEDSAGAFTNVPGINAGVEAPAIPGVARLGVSIERTTFARFCCGNPVWYRHPNFRDGWTQDQHPLGHPLGGQGSEWTARVNLDFLQGRGRVAASAFTRRRGDENLYADARIGHSTGGTLLLELDIAERLRAFGNGTLENGQGWREHSLGVGLAGVL